MLSPVYNYFFKNQFLGFNLSILKFNNHMKFYKFSQNKFNFRHII